MDFVNLSSYSTMLRRLRSILACALFLVHAGQPLNLLELPPQRHTPLPHQSRAIQAVKATKAARAQLVLPGGSGKTLIGIHLARDALTARGTVVVFLPTLTLLEQTLRSFYQDDPLLLDWKSQCLCVCSKLSFGDVEFTTDLVSIGSFIA